MKSNEQRINIIIGQLEGIKKMLSHKDGDCTSLIIQLKAIKAALSSLLEKIVAEEMGRCLVGQKKEQQEKVLKMLKELTSK
ncbi:MAG TPA: metal-sensitive transcriptional regulator [Patescibacteria group bacterium]|nr:metal-sensitive transcriptional regulator [Patescibacteria group bacterium]